MKIRKKYLVSVREELVALKELLNSRKAKMSVSVEGKVEVKAIKAVKGR